VGHPVFLHSFSLIYYLKKSNKKIVEGIHDKIKKYFAIGKL